MLAAAPDNGSKQAGQTQRRRPRMRHDQRDSLHKDLHVAGGSWESLESLHTTHKNHQRAQFQWQALRR